MSKWAGTESPEKPLPDTLRKLGLDYAAKELWENERELGA